MPWELETWCDFWPASSKLCDRGEVASSLWPQHPHLYNGAVMPAGHLQGSWEEPVRQCFGACPTHTMVGLTGVRPEAQVTQVELRAVPMSHRALVHVSRLLVAIAFQWGAHDEPGKEEKTREGARGGAPSW